MPDQTIYEKLTRYCAYQERCEQDIYQKLRKLKENMEAAPDYIRQLKEENYLNEERFVKAFVSGHLRKKWGKVKIKNELSRKGIESALIQKYLSAIEGKDYHEQLVKTATLKLKTIKAETAREKKIKLMRFLLGKGYESGQISEVVKQLIK